ncbi:MAG: urea carboxylase-associated family protein, partial [Gammaproteobacteria bacterium]
MTVMDVQETVTDAPPQRLWLAGGAATAVALEAGDRIAIVDVEGMQPVDVFAFDAEGRPNPAALGIKAARAASTALSAYLDGKSEQASALAMALREHGADAAAPGVALGEADNPPGTEVTLKAKQSVLVCIAAPGADTVLNGAAPPTEIELHVTRVKPEVEHLPPPLAEPQAEIRIKAGTAQAYHVAAGEYIQVIDVAGKQCSDFLAFDAADLARGEESGLDATTTRTLMGNIYPTPGLHSKFFDDKMRPLVEVVRDTVGRHDTFALACSAKSYEDKGYPG